MHMEARRVILLPKIYSVPGLNTYVVRACTVANSQTAYLQLGFWLTPLTLKWRIRVPQTRTRHQCLRSAVSDLGGLCDRFDGLEAENVIRFRG